MQSIYRLTVSMSINDSKASSRIGISGKLTLAVCVIVTVLLVSSIIAIFELRRMSDFVSERISDNIEQINQSTELAVVTDEYNLRILSIVGNADSIVVSGLDPSPYISVADSLVDVISQARLSGCDSLRTAYDEYKKVSFRLDSIIVSDFVDSRDWYFTELQPKYNAFKTAQDKLNVGIHDDLQANSGSFDESFYRSITPIMVSVAVAILLSILLLFFILEYYVRPLRRMLKGTDTFVHYSHPYNVEFEGNDQLKELNGYIKDIAEENILLKRRIRERER